MNVANTYVWIVLAGIFLGASLASCKKQTDPIGDEKKIQNDEDIRAYLAKNNITAQRTSEGLYYRVVSKGTSTQKASVGDEMKITYVARRLDGVLVDSSELSLNKPVLTIYGIGRFPFFSNDAMDLVFGTPLLTEGDSATLLIPSHLGEGAKGTLLFPAYSPVRIDLKVTAISTEKEQMDDFIKTNSIAITETTESGLRFGKTVARPDSVLLKAGDKVQVKYTGRRMDHSVFDSGTLTETVGSSNSVKGFAEGIAKLRVGEKANLLFPSALGYGSQGSAGRIAPFSPLYFEVEILSKSK